MRRYLLDEHIPPVYQTQLLYHEPSLMVLMVGNEGTPARGTPDPEILHWCEQNDFSLITNNRKSMPQHLREHLTAGHHVPGIFTIDLNAPMRVILEELILIAAVSQEDEYLDQIAYVPLR